MGVSLVRFVATVSKFKDFWALVLLLFACHVSFRSRQFSVACSCGLFGGAAEWNSMYFL